jgi:serine/threonine protein kinase/Tfp pilus assembly protein PilF
MIGQTISHYRILEKLGEGGMGVVYRAKDTKLDRMVALKFLPHDLASSAEDRARFVQEAKAASMLNHPNIATIYEINDAGPDMFIAMELVEGKNLKHLLMEGRQSTKEIIEIGVQIAEGLKAAHEKGVVHRDIKPDNIMVTGEGRIKIMDFGVAKIGNQQNLTKTGVTVGTISYMAPEQIQGGEVDQRADLWSLGVILYELSGHGLPFRGEHEAAIMYEILNVDPKDIRTVNAEVPAALQSVISRLLQKDPARRISSAAEVVELLKQTGAPPPASGMEKSVAVLYFENMSPDKESDYFCAGMTEDIITDLSKIKELKVASRSDVLPLRNKELNIRQAGESLNVTHILEGSIRKAANKIRITAQLIDVETGFHVWAERFDRLIEDIFEIQSDVSQKIAEALKISLTDSERESIAHKPTEDLRAYDFYMRGRDLLSRRGKKNAETAIQMFENAIRIDPNFTTSYAGLAEAASYMYAWYDGDARWLGKMIEMSQKTLALDPTSVDAMFSMGTMYFHQKRYTEARRYWEKAIEYQPDYYEAYRWLGIIADVTGDYDAAIRYYERGAAIKPFSEEPWMHIAMTRQRQGNPDAANEAYVKQLELCERKLAVNEADTVVLSRVAGVYAHAGETGKALEAMRKAVDADPSDGLSQYNCACTFGVMGNAPEALVCLRRAIAAGYRNVGAWVKSDPDLAILHDNEEFRKLLAEFE